METKDYLFRFGLDIQFFAEENEDEDDDISDDEIDDPDDEDEDEEEEESKEEGEKDKGEEEKRKQSQAQNAKYAQQRREAEAKAKAEKEAQAREAKRREDEAYRKGLREGVKENPYTHKAIEDDYDLEIYQIQLDLDNRGLNPTEDLPDELARRRREKAKAEQAEREKLSKEQAEKEAAKKADIEKKAKEIAEVKKKYNLTDDELKTMFNDPNDPIYKAIAEKGGRWTLAEIFNAYYKETKKNTRSTPSLTQGGSKMAKSFKDMTDEEYIEYAKEKHGGF